MKIKYLLYLIFLCFATKVKAQLQKGNFIIDGTSNFQYLNSSETSDYSLTISPNIQYFVTNKIAIGGQLTFISDFKQDKNFGLTTSTTIYISETNKLDWYLNGNFGFLTVYGDAQFHGNFGSGIHIFLSPNFALEAQVTYGFQNEDMGDIILPNPKILRFGTGLKFFFHKIQKDVTENSNNFLKKGTIFLGMTHGFINTINRGNAYTRVSNINLNPQFGVFFSNQWALGTNLKLSKMSLSDIDFSNFSFQATPFLRYYFSENQQKTAPFVQIGGGLNMTRIKGDYIENNSATGTNIFGGVGLNFLLNTSVAFEILAAYHHEKLPNNRKQDRLAIDFGFQFFIRKK